MLAHDLFHFPLEGTHDRVQHRVGDSPQFDDEGEIDRAHAHPFLRHGKLYENAPASRFECDRGYLRFRHGGLDDRERGDLRQGLVARAAHEQCASVGADQHRIDDR